MTSKEEITWAFTVAVITFFTTLITLKLKKYIEEKI